MSDKPSVPPLSLHRLANGGRAPSEAPGRFPGSDGSAPRPTFVAWSESADAPGSPLVGGAASLARRERARSVAARMKSAIPGENKVAHISQSPLTRVGSLRLEVARDPALPQNLKGLSERFYRPDGTLDDAVALHEAARELAREAAGAIDAASVAARRLAHRLEVEARWEMPRRLAQAWKGMAGLDEDLGRGNRLARGRNDARRLGAARQKDFEVALTEAKKRLTGPGALDRFKRWVGWSKSDGLRRDAVKGEAVAAEVNRARDESLAAIVQDLDAAFAGKPDWLKQEMLGTIPQEMWDADLLRALRGSIDGSQAAQVGRATAPNDRELGLDMVLDDVEHLGRAADAAGDLAGLEAAFDHYLKSKDPSLVRRFGPYAVKKAATSSVGFVAGSGVGLVVGLVLAPVTAGLAWRSSKRNNRLLEQLGAEIERITVAGDGDGDVGAAAAYVAEKKQRKARRLKERYLPLLGPLAVEIEQGARSFKNVLRKLPERYRMRNEREEHAALLIDTARNSTDPVKQRLAQLLLLTLVEGDQLMMTAMLVGNEGLALRALKARMMSKA